MVKRTEKEELIGFVIVSMTILFDLNIIGINIMLQLCLPMSPKRILNVDLLLSYLP